MAPLKKIREVRRGLALLEIVVAVALLAGVVALFLLSTQSSRSRSGARSAALVVAEAFRLAGQTAQARGAPVAVCFPSQSGTLAHTTAFYTLSGWDQPRLGRATELGNEYPGLTLFNGSWNAAAAAVGSASSKYPDFDPAAWLPADHSDDYCFIFLPDATVTSNGLPVFDDAYHLLVSAGVRYGAGAPLAPSGPAIASLQACGEAFTVSVSRGGAVAINAGVADAGVAIEGNIPVAAGAALPAAATASTSAPTIESLVVLSESNVVTLPGGVAATIGPNEFLNLDILATSPDGGELYCVWEATGGTFSIPGLTRMEWDAEALSGVGAWRSRWVWRPPPQAPDGSRYQLTCTVEEATTGLQVVSQDSDFPNGSSQIEVVRQGQLVFERDFNGLRQIFLRNLDGNYTQHLLESNANDRQPSVSNDGTRLALRSDRDGDYDIYGASFDSPQVAGSTLSEPVELLSSVFKISDSPGLESVPAISPAGDRIAWKMTDGSGTQLCMRAWDNTPPIGDYVRAPVGDPTIFNDRLAWTPDGVFLLYDGRPLSSSTAAPEPTQIYRLAASGGGRSLLAANAGPFGSVNQPGSNNQSPHVTRDGNWLYFSSDRSGGQFRIYRVRWDQSTHDVRQNPAFPADPNAPEYYEPEPINLALTGSVSLPTTNTDGSLLYVSQDDGGNDRLWRYDGSQLQQLTEDTELELHPSWIP